MENLSYQDFIKLLEKGSIHEILFQIKDYPHYKLCSIQRRKDVLENGREIILIDVRLTVDDTERVCFFKSFNETYKMFDMKKKGKFTLKQIWDKIQIIEIK